MAYLTIKYSVKPGLSKTTYLINPKGFQIKNNFTKKQLIGVFNTTAEKSKIVSEYIRLNPNFPIESWYVSDSQGNKVVTQVNAPITNTVITKPPIEQKPVIQDTIPLNWSDIIKPKTKSEKSFLESPIFLGLLILGLSLYLFNEND